MCANFSSEVRQQLTVEERIGLLILLALLAGLVVLGFSVASSQGAEVIIQ